MTFRNLPTMMNRPKTLGKAHTDKGRVLVVDDEHGIRALLRRALESEGYDVLEAKDGVEALEIFVEQEIDLIISDYLMPRMNGLDLLREVKHQDNSIAFLILTGMGSTEIAIQALRLQADNYLLKPFDIDELLLSAARAVEHRRLRLENRSYQAHLESRVEEQGRQLEALFVDGLLTIANAVEARDRYTGGHVERVTVYAVATGAAMGLGQEELRHLSVAALLHDIGKVAIPDHVLTKAGRLTPEEFEVMKTHPEIGAAIVSRSAFLRDATEGVLHHHERWDGAGYPVGLAGEAISLEGRILAVVDTFDAIVTTRPYRSMRSSGDALAELHRCAGTQFDPHVVQAFIRSYESGFTGGMDVACIRALRERESFSEILAWGDLAP